MSGSNTAICPHGVPIASSSVLIASPSRKIPQKIRTAPKRRPSLSNRLAIVVWFVLLLLAGRAAQAIDHTGDTRPYWTGRIEQDTTWRDTVYVGGDVTIAAAATLTLAPNTQVLFLPYHDDARGGLDSTRAELIVEGRLHAQAGGIVFRSADAGSLGADWYGLVVERGGQADLSNATIRDGLRCVYSQARGRVTMDAIAFANCGKPTAPEDAAGLSISQRRTQSLPALRQELPPLSMKTSRGDDRGIDKRIAKKLKAGALGGFVGFLGGTVLGFAALGVGGGVDGIGGREVFYFVGSVGSAVGSAVSVSQVDPHDLFAASLMGSILGFGAGLGLAYIAGNPNAFLVSPVFSVASAVWLSEDSRNRSAELTLKPPETGRFSLGLGTNPRRHLLAIAKLRF